MRRRAQALALLSVVAIVLVTGASFLIFHMVADAAGTGQCGGG